MKKTVLLFLIILFYSCNKTENKSTANQQQIITIYNKMNNNCLVESDSIAKVLKKLEFSSRLESDRYKAIVDICDGMLSVKYSAYEIATKKFLKAIQLLENTQNDTLVARAYHGIATCYRHKGEYPLAIKNYRKALQLYKKEKHIDGIAFVYSGLGQLYLDKGDIPFAKKNLEIVKELLHHQKYKIPYLVATHTLANIYGMSGDIKSALKIDDEGLRITDSIQSDEFKVTFLDNKANCFLFSNQLDSAQYYFNKCLEIDYKVGDKKQIADSYSNLGQLALFKKDYLIAEKQALKSLEILKKINHKTNMIKTYAVLEEIYTAQNKYEKIIETQKESFQIYKEMINEKKEAVIAEFNVLYDTQEKEKQIIESKAETSKKQSLLILISIIAIGVLIISFLIYRQQKIKNNQQAQEFELKSAISQIENQNKLQEQRLNISRDLHDNIGAQLTFIISSVDNIKYAFDITNEKLDKKLSTISNFTKETIVELRDTIWAMNSNEISFEDLELRINNYIEKAKEVKGEISFSFAIDEDLKSQKLTSVQGMNIYRTIQESINNAIKYASASIITVNAKKSGNQTKISIQDNGIGFDIQTIEKGNGLQNMQKRIEEIGGEFNLSSDHSGTKIQILI